MSPHGLPRPPRPLEPLLLPLPCGRPGWHAAARQRGAGRRSAAVRRRAARRCGRPLHSEPPSAPAKAALPRPRPRPGSLAPAPPPPATPAPGPGRIFVSVAAFRDADTAATLRNMFERAAHPALVHVGLVCQLDLERDPPCLPKDWAGENCSQSDWCPSDQVRVRTLSPRSARGPTWARYLAARMWQGERFFLQIDSHNRFVRGWDAVLRQAYADCPSKPRCVLSHYPEAYEPHDKSPLEERDTVGFLCGSRWNHDGFIEFSGAVTKAYKRPRLQPYASAGLLFTLGTVLAEVPYDPHLPFLFAGEEFLYTARLWTHGYDLYSPPRNALYHIYYRFGAPKVWSEPGNNWYLLQRGSVRRLQWIVGSTREGSEERLVPLNTTDPEVNAGMGPRGPFGRYGLGADRSMAAYWEFAGHDPRKRVALKSWCDQV
eukprot:TRINITY_DN15045_c0_g2_i3.p1 TRINITY_DN15045_c0_g2~~TRINITY_DN15045_c0_g2_i3.p1  ORF type:complete len:452 (+),score=117.61 TRINITY_DN15045_c0_g2_i3:69-1358(+)